jgi:hypothetical protein
LGQKVGVLLEDPEVYQMERGRGAGQIKPVLPHVIQSFTTVTKYLRETT